MSAYIAKRSNSGIIKKMLRDFSTQLSILGRQEQFPEGKAMNAIKFIFIICLTLMVGVSCAGTEKWQSGAMIGAAVGAGAGAIIGHQSGHKEGGAVIGGAVGAITGGLIGKQLDKQEAELAEIAEVKRVSEEELVVILKEKILFDIDKYSLKPAAEDNINKIADILVKYPDFDITVEGHTDSTGKETYNQTLSEKRAGAVADFLAGGGLDQLRLQTIGYGETRPVASNETADGRAENRRVEIHITPRQV
jgi:outer membrane protein OmpA-like peptidoglycan-associated protein